MRPPSRLCIDLLKKKLLSKKLWKKKFEKTTTRTYETSQSCDRVHLGHLKKKLKKKNVFEKKLKKKSKVKNQNISYGRAS